MVLKKDHESSRLQLFEAQAGLPFHDREQNQAIISVKIAVYCTASAPPGSSAATNVGGAEPRFEVRPGEEFCPNCAAKVQVWWLLQIPWSMAVPNTRLN